MKRENFTLEEIEYLLILNKCEYLYGFKDSFIKYDKSIVKNVFEKIAEGLEERNLISRSFKGEVKYSDNLKDIIDIIIRVENYYDITIIDLDKVSIKYRIYETKSKYVIIEALANDKGILDFDNLVLYFYNYDDIKKASIKIVEKNFRFDENCNDNSEISIGVLLYKEIPKLSEEAFLKKIKCENDTEKETFKSLYNVVNKNDKVMSIAITNMKDRKSTVYMYVNGLKKVFRMAFKINGENHKWLVQEISKSQIENEIDKILKLV